MSEASVKLLSRGVETLTDQELLELLLDDGDSERLAGAVSYTHLCCLAQRAG